MSIRLKCPCGQLMNAPDGAAGKKTRCPSCQTLLQVPLVVAPVLPAADPFADLPASTPQAQHQGAVQRPQAHYRPPAQTTAPNYPNTPHSQSGSGNAVPPRKTTGHAVLIALILAFVGTGLLTAGGIAIWLLVPMGSGEAPIEDRFTPVASQTVPATTPATAPENSGAATVAAIGRSARETAMLAVAEKFARHARQNEHHEAVAMIDPKLFHARLYSPKGSYEAMTKDIPAAKLLSNFGNYALDGAPVGGHRHWQIIGTSQFEGNDGVVLRYYAEPQSPLDALTDPKLFSRLGAVINYEQLTQKASQLFTHDGQKTSHFDQYGLSSHAIHRAFPARAGYMMLVFDSDQSDPKLVDLVNVLGQAPLSRSGSHVFLDDYHTFGGFGSRETYGTKRTTLSLYGLTAVSSGASWNPNEAGAEERARQQAANATEAEEQKRPKRLEKLMELWARADTKLQSELDRFKADFPNDLGFELAVVCQKMAAPKPTFTAPPDKVVLTATQALYRQWHDPFFQYVEALYQLQNSNQQEAEQLFGKCVAAGFAPTDYYISRIESQLDRSDTTGILATLEEWNRNLMRDGLAPDSKRLEKLAIRYKSLQRELNPQPSIGDRMASSGRGPSSGRLSQANQNGMGPPPGFGQPPPGFGQPSSGPPTPSGPQVTIKISGKRGFDGNQIAQKLAAALSVKGYQFSQSNQDATLKLSFAGPLQEVADAIDFGTVVAKDEDTNTITVEIP